MAWKRAFQSLTAVAETWLAVWKRGMLVALRSVLSDDNSSGSNNTLCVSYIHERTRDICFGATGETLGTNVRADQKTAGRAEKIEGNGLKIAVSATSGSLDAQIDPRFGRCPYFVLVDSETMKFEAVPNIASSQMSGAGIQAAQTLANKGINVVLTGSVGPNAFQTLSSSGINIITSVLGTVREAVEKFKSGGLQKTNISSGPLGFDMGGGFGMGMGRGGGRGRGGGGGRGKGFRRWQATGPTGPQAPITPSAMPTMLPQMPKEQEMQMLGNQMKGLQKQLDQIRKRLEELRKQKETDK